MKPAQLLVAKFPMGHVMGEQIIPLMIIRYGDDHHFKHKCKPELNGRGEIQNMEQFLEKLNKYKPGIVRAVRDMGQAVILQVWPERVCVYLGRPMHD